MGQLTLAMIVRDEARWLPSCLQSVKGIVDEMVVVDTGSRDDTPRIARQFGARVIEIPWRQDFARARNVSLDYVKTPWVLVLDADEQLHPDDAPLIRMALQTDKFHAYDLWQVSLLSDAQDVAWARVTRLFRNLPGIRYEGRIHEQVASNVVRHGYQLASLDARLWHFGYLRDIWTEKAKAERNYNLLQRAVREEPGNGYLWWQLAQSAISLEEWNMVQEATKKALDAGTLPDSLVPVAWLTLGKGAAGQGVWTVAAAAFARAEQTALPNPFADAVFYRGEVHRANRAWAAAEQAFSQALTIGDTTPIPLHEQGTGSYRAWYGLASTYWARGENDRAAATALVAYRHYPAYRPLWLLIRQIFGNYTPREFAQVIPNVAADLPGLVRSQAWFPGDLVDQEIALGWENLPVLP